MYVTKVRRGFSRGPPHRGRMPAQAPFAPDGPVCSSFWGVTGGHPVNSFALHRVSIPGLTKLGPQVNSFALHLDPSPQARSGVFATLRVSGPPWRMA